MEVGTARKQIGALPMLPLEVLMYCITKTNRLQCYDRALLPSIICLGRLLIACRYIYNL